MLQIDGPPAPETLRRDQLARRERIVRTAARALANGDYDQVKVSDVARDSGVALKKKLEKERPHGDSEAERLRDVLHQTIRAFQLQPQFYRVVMMLNATTDTYAADLYESVSAQFREALQMAFAGPFDADHDAIFSTVNSVLDGSLRAWVMNRATIQDVYRHVDDAIRLIYEYSPN